MPDSASEAIELYRLPGFYEPFSVISHLLGAAVCAILGKRLVRRGRGDRLRVAVLAVYVASCVSLLSLSAVYHMMVTGGSPRAVMERLDHSAIFALIAGTFTPVHGILFRGLARWGPLALIWGVAIVGITLKSIFFESLPEWLGLSFYLSMGWLGAFSCIAIARRFGFGFIKPLAWGGLAYSIGAILEFRAWPTLIPGAVHPHELFHLAVLIGVFLHWSFIWRIASWPAAGPLDPIVAGSTADANQNRRFRGTS